MFRVSRRLDYGLQLMIALASTPEGRATPTAALAEKLDIPLPFLHQIGHLLMQSGLIRATPGPRGGLRLSRSSDEINLRQIADALEGALELSPCQECTSDCPRRLTCTTKMVWNNLQEKVNDHLSAMQLSQLVEQIEPSLA